MDQNTLKMYLKNVYELEASVYSQKKLVDNVSYHIYNLRQIREKSLLQEETLDDYLDLDVAWVILKSSIASGPMLFFIFLMIKTEINGGLRRTGAFSLFMDWLRNIGWSLLLGLAIGLVIELVIVLVNFCRVRLENSKIKEKNQYIIAENEKNTKNARQKISLLNTELHDVQNQYEKTKDILNQYYSKNIIYPKYRNLVAVSSFYEYFCSGRCSQLEGHEGAYNIFETEVRLDKVICKLDEVIEQLEEIRNNQYMLYSAIKEGNRRIGVLSDQINKAVMSLDNIESHARVTEYYGEITAKNTEFLKWIHILDI